jgi:hypothetical protein
MLTEIQLTMRIGRRIIANMSNANVSLVACCVAKMARLVDPEIPGLTLDIGDFLSEEIKGPATFYCNGKKNGCKFEEPAMNELIGSVFGDKSIFLNCESSECLYYTEVPGYQVIRLIRHVKNSDPSRRITRH